MASTLLQAETESGMTSASGKARGWWAAFDAIVSRAGVDPDAALEDALRAVGAQVQGVLNGDDRGIASLDGLREVEGTLARMLAEVRSKA